MTRASSPEPPRASPHAFADWVFRQYHPRPRYRPADYSAAGEDEAREERRKLLGWMDHQAIHALQRSRGMNHHFLNLETDYRAIYADDGQPDLPLLSISRLTFEGRQFRCRPDLVLTHRRKSHLIIVERKTTRVGRPIERQEDWANIAAQLWCYSFIDDFADFEDISLVCEIWHNQSGALHPASNPQVWDAGDVALHDKCLSLFRDYGGRFNPLPMRPWELA